MLPGTVLGPYEITGPLGAGGMGEVYRARDTTLNRDVAIKLLPESVALDPVRLARFEREARTLAALNHPHIAQIYGLEEAGARGKALVMELVGGQTLAERIAHGPLPVAEALDIARQMADALEAAHAEGIVHRDLKPANVKVRDDGAVKVLDFGLAKGGEGMAQGSSPADRLADSPTFTSPAMTERGIILGTAAYMSPEQARGRSVDKRADIWAFGVVLFEMLTGRQMFAGETVSDTLAAVLREEIDWKALPPSVSPALRRVLERTLQKDPKRRLRDIGDARLEIEEAMAGRDVVAAPQASVVLHDRPASRLPWMVAAAAVVAAAALSVWALTRSTAPPDAGMLRFTQLTDTAGEEKSPALSPDGTMVAFASRAAGSWDIYSQRVGGRNRALIVGDPERDEAGPAYSPDGTQIAFYEADRDGGIFIAGATGESIRRVSDIGFHPAWSPDGARIAFTTEEIFDPYSRQGVSRLWVVASGGGDARAVTETDAAQPSYSPSGKRIAYWANIGGRRDIYSIDAAGGTPVALTDDADVDFSPVWSHDGRHIIFASDRGGSINLWQIPVDEQTGRATGRPAPLTSGVQAATEFASISRSGERFAFRSRVSSVNPHAIAFDPVTLRAGAVTMLDSANSILIPSGVSPDGRQLVLYNQGARQEDVFITGFDRFAPRRITDDAARDRAPTWTPDGRAILFYSTRGGKWEIWSVNADGGGARKLASVSDSTIYPLVSPAGDRMAMTSITAGRIHMSPVSRDTITDAPVLPGTGNDRGAMLATSWSPDGRLLAGPFVTATGAPLGVAVYDIDAKKLAIVSEDRSFWVAWLPDSQRVIYFADRNQLTVVDIASGQRTAVDVALPMPSVDDAFAIARDGRTIYYGGARSESDIWIAERVKR
jgi:Tol biopolymer transport system component